MDDKIKLEIEIILKDFILLYINNSKNGGHMATGNLANNAKADIKIDNNVYHISLSFPDYFYWAENGRGPGKFPPINKIKEWIRIKPVLPRLNAKTGKLPTENLLAYLIGRKIALKGTEGSHVLEKTINDFNLTGKLYDAVADKFLELVNENLFWD